MKCRPEVVGARGRSRLAVFLSRSPFYLVFFLTLAAAVSCATSLKLEKIRSEEMSASLRLPDEKKLSEPSPEDLTDIRDTPRITDLEGHEVYVMKAGEALNAARVTARFRNVAERGGKVDIEFQLIAPGEILDSKWQLRLHPLLKALDDTFRLDDVLVTGVSYRRAQLRGYQQYERFLSRIVTDSLRLVDVRNLEIFIARNMPQIFAFKSDTSFVSDEQFSSLYGVTEQQAVDHYTRSFLLWRNRWVESRKERMWDKYVKSPIVTESVRLDTVVRGENGEFVYNYVQPVNVRPGLRKVEVSIGGELYEGDACICRLPESSPLTFYISSVGGLADLTPRYRTMVVSRNLEENLSSRLDFRSGKSEIDEGLGDNESRIKLIKRRLKELYLEPSLEMDSIVIVASASPEGSAKSNYALSQRRAEAVSNYFLRYLEYLKDSLRREEGFRLSLSSGAPEEDIVPRRPEISFISRSGGENWALLDVLVERDTALDASGRAAYLKVAGIEDLDRREESLRRTGIYSHLRSEVYPSLRVVDFNFYLHRSGMLKDTVHTTVLDSVYMRGLKALQDYDYRLAAELLAEYSDYNMAVACVALGRNANAEMILDSCPPDAKVDYLRAIVAARLGRERDAVEAYVRSCRADAAMVHRGNLDPEISELIRKYGLNKEEPF